MKDNCIYMDITCYPINVDYELELKILKTLKIPYRIYNDLERIKTLRHHCLSHKKEKNNWNCLMINSNSVQLRNGKLYICPSQAYIDIFNDYFNENFKLNNDCYLDVYNCTDEQIISMYHTKNSFCEYCREPIEGNKYSTSKKVKKRMDVKYCLKTQIVDECNLNCKGCDHFAPLAKKWHQPLDDFTKMMKTIKDTVGNHIKEIELYGGEPLLHEQLYEMIMCIKVLFPKYVAITIETNGILLDKFLQRHKDLIDDKRLEIKITEYKVTKGIIEKLKHKYCNNNIYQAMMLKNELSIINDSSYKENMFNVNIQKNRN